MSINSFKIKDVPLYCCAELLKKKIFSLNVLVKSKFNILFMFNINI